MKCPKCSGELSSEAVMCPTCGAYVVKVEEQSEKPRSKPVWPYIAGGALLCVIIIALVAMSVLSGPTIIQSDEPKPQSGPVTTNAPETPAPGGPVMTSAPDATTPQGPATTDAPKPVPPKDVVEYLNFVKMIEEKRNALLRDTSNAVALSTGAQAQSILDMMDMVVDESSTADKPKRAEAVENELTRHLRNWHTLVREFDGRPAPQACGEFAGNYRAVLTTETYQIDRVTSIINNLDWTSVDSMSKASAELNKMKSDPNLQGSIDKAVELADSKLSELCSRIGLDKPFTVRKETGGGSIIGVGP